MTTAPSAAAKRRTLVLIAVGAAVVLVLGGILLARWARKKAVGAGGPKRIVVLPFENRGPVEDDYFADGVADAVRGKLASLPGLEVIARAAPRPTRRHRRLPCRSPGSSTLGIS